MTGKRRFRCLITAGPTREWLDPVRFISNPSSGKMGYAIAEAAHAVGWDVTLVSGPVGLPVPDGFKCERVTTAEEMLAAVQQHFADCDILIKTAAVCDMRPVQCAEQKVKKSDMEWTVSFEPTPDILKTVAATKKSNQLVVGFAAETQDVEAYARQKLHDKNLDYICANCVAGEEGAFESDFNALQVIRADGRQWTIGPATKVAVARELIELLTQDDKLA